MNQVNSQIRKSLTALLAAALMLPGTFLSCGKASSADPMPGTIPDTAVTETSPESADTAAEETEEQYSVQPDELPEWEEEGET